MVEQGGNDLACNTEYGHTKVLPTSRVRCPEKETTMGKRATQKLWYPQFAVFGSLIPSLLSFERELRHRNKGDGGVYFTEYKHEENPAQKDDRGATAVLCKGSKTPKSG